MVPGLEADCARVADLEAQILHPSPERSISALRKEKILAQERLDSYKYPVLELPNEIVSDIFMHFLPTYPSCPPLIGLRSPTVLTHVCRRWREIALSTPALWSAIRASYFERIPLKQKAHIFDLWLKRSRFCPLSLRLETGLAEILAAVVPHRARWECLELKRLSPSYLPIIEGPIPLLRHLSLGLSEYPATNVLAFRDAPLLRTVVLSPDAASSVILPWAQLTSLTLCGFYPRECVPVLQKTFNLVCCQLSMKFCFDSDNDQPQPDIVLPYLESLRIGQYGASPVTDFLETFIVPALRSLKIPEEFLRPSPIDSLTGFISKSGCKLEEVHIGSDLRSLRQDSYRQAFPSIRKFSFDSEDDSSDSDASDVEDNSGSE
ncbi:hypothetical protein B0H13DRAFT_223460 [Mycena leptocephala]|nr:hypothetical protein B0H13DRAFT_223460 [Mycena leptocephala]